MQSDQCLQGTAKTYNRSISGSECPKVVTIVCEQGPGEENKLNSCGILQTYNSHALTGNCQT